MIVEEYIEPFKAEGNGYTGNASDYLLLQIDVHCNALPASA